MAAVFGRYWLLTQCPGAYADKHMRLEVLTARQANPFDDDEVDAVFVFQRVIMHDQACTRMAVMHARTPTASSATVENQRRMRGHFAMPA